MEIVNGSIVVEADGVIHIVASFSFDSPESGMHFLGFCTQYIYMVLSGLVKHKVPVHCEIDPVAFAELGEYNATIVVGFPDSEWVARLLPVMVYLSKNMSDLAESEIGNLVDWATYEEMGALA